MKKIYSSPRLLTVEFQMTQHLMALSEGGTASISTETADGDAFVKNSRSDYNVWNDDWSK